MLSRELRARIRDLASPAASLLETLLPRDPTLEVLRLAEHWTPAREPERADGVWYDPDRKRALLLVETEGAGFDPDAQRRALDALQAAFAELAADDLRLRLVVSGPGSISAVMKERTQAEAGRFGTAAMVGLVLILALAYRRLEVIPLGAMPLASAALAGLAAVSLTFGEVHGITLAFGFTLIGVAQDYPMHLFSHQHPGLDPQRNVRLLWPTMATGVASTCIAYAAFLLAGATGLAQLGVFTISGLAVAALGTRYLLPRIIGEDYRDNGDTAEMRAAARMASRMQAKRWFGSVLAAIGVTALLLAPGPFWDDDLARLTPVPQELIEQDLELRNALGAPDVRYLLGVQDATAEGVLTRLEALEPALRRAVADGLLDGYDHAARYLPSIQTQRQRQAALPDPDALRTALGAALAGLPFRPGVFEPFIGDVAAARRLEPLAPGDLEGTPLAGAVGALLHERAGEWIAVVTLVGVHEATALGRRIEDAGTGAVLADLKRASMALVVEQRNRMLGILGLAAVLLMLVVRAALGDWRRSRRVLTPMGLTTLLVVAVLQVAGQPLNLFHLISLVLAAGLGLDYALFFERAAADERERRRTLHGVLVCAASTLLVFALLGLSSIPVLRSIGVTVALGVVGNFLLALLLARSPPGESRGDG